MKKQFVLSVIFVLLLSASYAAAALELEQNYPVLPGGQTLTPFTSLFIFASGIIAFITLLGAGFKYLTSVAQPVIMAQAKSQILNSFLGILILLGSYLILNLINPQLLVLRAEKQPIEVGVVLLTKQGVTDLRKGDSLNTILIKGEARYLRNSIKDMIKEFGELSVTKRAAEGSPLQLNFKDFPIHSLGFFDNETSENITIVSFPLKNFKVPPSTDQKESYYTRRGKIDIETSSVLRGFWVENNLRVVPIDFVTTTLSFKDEGPSSKEGSGKKITTEISHPPLSLSLKITKPGIYLFAQDLKESVYLSKNNPDLTTLNFNEKTEKIKIRNGRGIVKTNDFLAVLHQDRYFSGGLRIFFEKRKIEKRDIEQVVGNVPTSTSYIETGAEKVNKSDGYGKVEGVSSVQLFDLGPEYQCRKVKICQKPNFGGYCLAFLAPGEELTDEEKENVLATSSLPIYQPINIPDSFQEVIEEWGLDSLAPKGQEIIAPSTLPPSSPLRYISSQSIKFNKEIRSLEIQGNCLVVLFENKITDPETGQWENNTTGPHSQTITKTEYDLTNLEIGRCGGPIRMLFASPKPCASAIAVYPLK